MRWRRGLCFAIVLIGSVCTAVWLTIFAYRFSENETEINMSAAYPNPSEVFMEVGEESQLTGPILQTSRQFPASRAPTHHATTLAKEIPQTRLLSLGKRVISDVRGNLGDPSVVTNEKVDDWLKDRWQG